MSHFRINDAGEFEKYTVRGMYEKPNMVILVENQSSKEEKITFNVSINNEKFSKNRLETQGAENFYFKFLEENFKLKVEVNDQIVEKDFLISENHQIFVVFTYNKDSILTINRTTNTL